MNAPYEPPIGAEVEAPSDALTAKEAAEEIVQYLKKRWLTGEDVS